MTGESQWNGRREIIDPSVCLLFPLNPKRTTEEKPLTHLPSSASVTVTAWMQSIIKFLV